MVTTSEAREPHVYRDSSNRLLERTPRIDSVRVFRSPQVQGQAESMIHVGSEDDLFFDQPVFERPRLLRKALDLGHEILVEESTILHLLPGTILPSPVK